MWARRQETESTQSWIYQNFDYKTSEISFTNMSKKQTNISSSNRHGSNDLYGRNVDLRNLIKEKASKHRDFYRSLVDNANKSNSSETIRKMSVGVLSGTNLVDTGDHKEKCEHFKSTPTTEEISVNSEGSLGQKYRQRKLGVYEITTVEDSTEEPLIEFKSVKQLRQHYQAMLEKTYKNLSIDDKECTPEKEKPSNLLLPPSSGYCSSSASGGSDDEKEKNSFRKVLRRSASSDSAVHSDEECPNLSNWSEKRDDFSPTEGK